MANKISLKAQTRTLMGRKVKQLRKEGLIPANIYGGKIDSLAVSVTTSDFKEAFKEAGETHIINVDVDGEKSSRPTLIYNIQTDPMTRKVLHVDFRQVDLKEKITATIPIELVGESQAEAQGAVVVAVKNEVEVEALPTELPETLQADISALKEIGDSLTIADLKVDHDKVKILAEPEDLIVKAEEPKAEEPTEAEAPAEGEAEAPAEGEAEAPAEGEPQA